jgi:predicted AAA+ superfamily ATPase
MTVREKRGLVAAATFFDKLAAGDDLAIPTETPDLRGYVDLALESGFPVPALQSDSARRHILESYLDQLLTRDIANLEAGVGRRRDTRRLRRYFEAYALNSGGVLEHKTIYDAAQVNRITANAYEELLTGLFVVEQVPAWSSNRLKRLVHQAKRYVIDPALIAAALRLDARGVLSDGDLLGRVLDTFVAMQLRAELSVSESGPRLFHLRTEQGRREIDLVAELGGGLVVGVEVKAGAAPSDRDARHLAWLRDALDDRFLAGVVLHTGPRSYRLGDRISAVPISALWG